MLARLSITRQFTLLGAVGLLITLIAVGLSFSTTYQVALQAREAELRATVESGVSIAEKYVSLARSGAMPVAEAQKLAQQALGRAEFTDGGYFFVFDASGITLVHPNKALIGNDKLYLHKDPYGTVLGVPLVAAAEAGHPIFHEYYFPKPGSTMQQPKISYGAMVPGWRWVICNGIYIDDIKAMVLHNFARLAAILLTLSALYVVVIIFLRRAFARLVEAMTTSMERIAGGAFQTPIPSLSRRDQLGRMAKAVGTFRDSAVARVRLESEAEAARAAAAAERSRAEAARADAARRQEFVVTSVATGLQRLATGDLLFRLETAFDHEYEGLRRDFNVSMDKLHAAMTTITQTTQAVRAGAGEISHATDDLAHRTEQQAAGLEQTAAALDQITAAVRRTADGAQEARGLVSAARAEADRSGAVAQRTVGAIGSIADSSGQIAGIVGLIDEIAFQTNLLALNAGVEAARAGEAGRGFAVVATEVRALAQRSADAAKDIKALISGAGEQVDSGVTLVAETGEALARIAEQISRLDELVNGIASSAREQSTGLSEVNTALNQMDQATQQNAAMVEQATAAGQSLASESQTLANLIGQFRLGDGHEGQAARDAAMPRALAV